jgi:hypothetical protein
VADSGHSTASVHRSGSGRGRSHDDVNVITEARPSYDDEFRARRKRYVVMMAMRVPCLVLAAVFYHTPWLALLIILISIPLPWMAVLIANDGPARKKKRAPRGVINDQRAITGPAPDVVDGVADPGAGR